MLEAFLSVGAVLTSICGYEITARNVHTLLHLLLIPQKQMKYQKPTDFIFV